jgi:hypothetical protein
VSWPASISTAILLTKNFLYAHNSFDRESLQGYLNLFTLAMNPPSDNLEKVELLLNSAFKTRKTKSNLVRKSITHRLVQEKK